MISVICCYNNPILLKNMLLQSLSKQDIDIEFVMMDNTSNKYKSAAEALNEGAKKSKGDILIFTHQDVELLDSSIIRNIENLIKELGNNVIVGAAGIADTTGVLTNILHGQNKALVNGLRVISPIRIQTLDEVLIAIRSIDFNKIKFDEKTCSNWDLYVVDLCLSSISEGILSYVIPLELFHKSTGKLSNEYYNTLYKVARKHRKTSKRIYTTCSTLSTSFGGSICYVLLCKIKILIKKYFSRKLF